jgi:hypothetical protein
MSQEKFAIFSRKISNNFMYQISLLHTSLAIFFLVDSLIGIHKVQHLHNAFALVSPSPKERGDRGVR